VRKTELQVTAVNCGIKKLLQIQSVNHLQVLALLRQVQLKEDSMVEHILVKAFKNSIEVNNAIAYIEKLKEMHKSFCARLSTFASEYAEVLDEFDLIEEGDPVADLYREMKLEFFAL